MNRLNWISLNDIKDDTKIFVGTKVKLYSVGLNVDNIEDDYYEYIVSFIYGNEEYLQLTNISQGEAGNIICVIKVDLPNRYSLGKELKKMMCRDKSYVFFE